MNFREEAVILVKEILDELEQNKDFERAVIVLEDYLTDMDTKYQGIIDDLKGTY